MVCDDPRSAPSQLLARALRGAARMTPTLVGLTLTDPQVCEDLVRRAGALVLDLDRALSAHAFTVGYPVAPWLDDAMLQAELQLEGVEFGEYDVYALVDFALDRSAAATAALHDDTRSVSPLLGDALGAALAVFALADRRRASVAAGGGPTSGQPPTTRWKR